MRTLIAKLLKNDRITQIKSNSKTTDLNHSIRRQIKIITKDLKSALSENIVLVYICTIYYAMTFVLGKILGSDITGNISFYYILFFEYLFAFYFAMWSLLTITYVMKNNHQGLNGIPEIWQQLRNRYLCSSNITRFTIIFALLPIFSCSYSSIKQTIPLFRFFSYDYTLYRIDSFLHFNHTPWELLQTIIGFPLITQFIDFCYLAWVTIFAFTILYMACYPHRRLRLQFFISLACCWIFIGNILAILLSSAGPCYFTEVTGSTVNPYAGLFDYLQTIPGLKAVAIQTSLWDAFRGGQFMPLGGISAMPSMHVSIAVLLALLYKNINRYAGWILICFAVIIQIGSVHLGWHYAVDGYLSTILTILIWKLVGRKLA